MKKKIILLINSALGMGLLQPALSAPSATADFHVQAVVVSTAGIYGSGGTATTGTVNVYIPVAQTPLTINDLMAGATSSSIQETLATDAAGSGTIMSYYMTDDNGSGSNFGLTTTGGTLPLQVWYKDCSQPAVNSGSFGTQVTRNLSTGLTEAQSSEQSGCSAWESTTSTPATAPTIGVGAGVLSFVIPQITAQQATQVAAGTYTDTVTVDVCTTDTCAP